MYIRPMRPFGGSFFARYAISQSMAFLSMHIGSGPGVAGLSPMQVNSLLPGRTVRMAPLASMATMVASAATLAGPARMALWIIASSAGIALVSAAAIAAWSWWAAGGGG